MTLMFFLPVTTIEDIPHVLLHYDFRPKRNRYFLSAYQLKNSTDVSQLVRSSDFLRDLIDIDCQDRCQFHSTSSKRLTICTLEIDHRSSIIANAIRLENQSTRFQRRETIHLWICIQDLLNGLVTCNDNLKTSLIFDVLTNIDRTIQRQRREEKLDEIKSFKNQARQLIWDLMEMKREVRFPRPSHGRIPNFHHCQVAAENVTTLDCFKRAKVVKINPSLAQEALRYLTLSHRKILLVPSPALETVFFYKLDPKSIRRDQFEWASTKPGAAQLGNPLDLSSFKEIHIDLIVVASVVVNPITGARIGKGKGFGDLEFAILTEISSINDQTIVMTTCHESQLINDLPNEVMEDHDLSVDIIVTPSRCIYTKRLFKRPERVFWEKIDAEMFRTIPVLNELKRWQNERSNLVKQERTNGKLCD